MADVTNIPGVSVDEVGSIVLRYIGKNGERHQIDLTAEIERIAKAAVAEHMKAYHGHQL